MFLSLCGDDVVLISVKEIALKSTGDASIDWDRWRRKAIDESVKQLYGAERSLKAANRVIRAEGSVGLALPDAVTRRA